MPIDQPNLSKNLEIQISAEMQTLANLNKRLGKFYYRIAKRESL